MRLGAPLFDDCSTPELWIAALKRKGYSAAYCPVGADAADDVVKDWAEAAREADIVIAEVGAWSNPLSPDQETARAALEYCKRQLDLAERIGATCCVNIAGSRGDVWDGPHSANYTQETFDLIVATVREIIDAVQPRRTYYTLETMPWMYPDSADSYLSLIRAIDRPAFAAHFDPVNIVNSPARWADTGGLIKDFIERLGPWIRSCHAKDVTLATRLTVHIDEVRPGLGALDYSTYLRCLDSLDGDIPLMLEHLATEQDYDEAAAYIRTTAAEIGVAIR
ncbi:MAG: sugar phosphate isomerase/epimerase [Armatimonadetes bacterium]|nr:sugar phosphate isomerase/epimerase [Armatimonadota bacterium]